MSTMTTNRLLQVFDILDFHFYASDNENGNDQFNEFNLQFQIQPFPNTIDMLRP